MKQGPRYQGLTALFIVLAIVATYYLIQFFSMRLEFWPVAATFVEAVLSWAITGLATSRVVGSRLASAGEVLLFGAIFSGLNLLYNVIFEGILRIPNWPLVVLITFSVVFLGGSLVAFAAGRGAAYFEARGTGASIESHGK